MLEFCVLTDLLHVAASYENKIYTVGGRLGTDDSGTEIPGMPDTHGTADSLAELSI